MGGALKCKKFGEAVVAATPVLLCYLVVCCYACLGLGLNCMQDLGVEEMGNGLNKPSEERNLAKI